MMLLFGLTGDESSRTTTRDVGQADRSCTWERYYALCRERRPGCVVKRQNSFNAVK